MIMWMSNFYQDVSWLDVIYSETYTTLVKSIKVEIETKFTDKNGDLVFITNHQHCPLNMDTRLRFEKII